MWPPTATGATISIRWLQANQGTEAGQLWKALEPLGNGGLACSWDWTDAWLEHYGDLVPYRFAVGEVQGRPQAIALVTNGVGRKRGPFPVRSIHLGTAGEPPGEAVFPPYNRILCHEAHRSDFASALVGELGRESDWHELVLDEFSPEEAEPFLRAEPMFETRPDVCPTVDLQAAAAKGSVVATLGSSTRWKIRRALRGLGDVETEWAETPDDALDILAELVLLHQARWNRVGQPGVFSSARFAGFHRDLIPRLVPKGNVILFRVRASGETVGCVYHFVERGRVLMYQMGLAAYPDQKVRPGFVACALAMESAFQRGLLEYDFLAGDSEYKRRLSTSERNVVSASFRRPSLRWSTIDRLGQLKRKAAGGIRLH